MRDLDDLQDLKREYLRLVRTLGEEAAELRSFKRSLLEMNRRHRKEAASMYAKMIAKLEKKTGSSA
jgi:hypothetical protein